MATKKEIYKLLEDPKLKDALREAGYRLSREPSELVTKTFKIPKDTADAFYKKVRSTNYKVQEAIDEALIDWVNKR